MLILKMKDTGNILVLESAIKKLQKIGYDVLVKEQEDGTIFFALLGQPIDGYKLFYDIPFVNFTGENERNKFLDSAGAGYIEAWEFLEKRRGKKEVGSK